MVASIFYCINLVALQCIAPTILLLAMACLYKTVAGLSWFPTGLFTAEHHSGSTGIHNAPALTESDFGQWISDSSTNPDDAAASWFTTVSQARIAFSRFTEILSVRGMAVARGVFGFLVWWCLAALQSVSLLGLAYHRFAST
ncbi:unnamed protein product [Echinostoma caproni]|uniref:Uncharacterized protein n=1 Tax=Echinostoma caproni TaxID=27848 RepID=A0A3P8CM77_9TREM|nr:unnamed protein product [Echinostoma caproni]